LLEQIEANLGSGIDPQETGFTSPPSAFPNAGPNWLQIAVTSTTGAAGVKPYWKAQLLAGAYESEAPTASAPTAGGFSIASTGDMKAGDTGSGSVFGPTISTEPSSADASQITSVVKAALARVGLSLTSLSFVQPYRDFAPVVVAQTADPAGWVAKYGVGETAVFGGTSYEGTYLEVDDTNGSPVTIVASAMRVGQATTWVRPDLEPFTNP
jgi:hypothetical protein